MNTYVYEFGDSLYLNITNRCPNNCEFCLRNFKDGVNDNELWLKAEPTFDDMVEDLSLYDLGKYRAVVFCGFGEPMCNLSLLSQVAPYLKRKGVSVRINTNGLGNLINNRDDVPKLIAPYIDCVSISLNASTPKAYQEICKSKYGEDAFYAMMSFAKDCVENGIRTKMSVVDFIGESEIEACRKLAESVGAEFRVRATIHEGDKY
ncbi:MAG: TatD family nuclease-associated radical SAM protein [Clostridia bacterium]